MTLAAMENRRRVLAELAAAVLATEIGTGHETEAVRALLEELRISGWIMNKHEWYFEPECREHDVVHLQHNVSEVWITIEPNTGEVIFS